MNLSESKRPWDVFNAQMRKKYERIDNPLSSACVSLRDGENDPSHSDSEEHSQNLFSIYKCAPSI